MIYLTVGHSHGTTIDGLVADLADLATRLGIPVQSDFNGVRISASPNADISDAVERYNEAQRHAGKLKMILLLAAKKGAAPGAPAKLASLDVVE